MLNTWELSFNSMWRQLFVFVLWLSSGLGRHTDGSQTSLSSNQRWPSASDTKSANQSFDLNRHDDIRQQKHPASALKHQLASFFSSVSPILGHFPRDAQRSTWTTELQKQSAPEVPTPCWHHFIQGPLSASSLWSWNCSVLEFCTFFSS